MEYGHVHYGKVSVIRHAANQSSHVSITQMARKRKLGRKRKYRTIGSRNRMRAHRAKQVPQSASQLAWSRYLAAIGLGMNRGEVMTDAPSSTIGRLETGGMDFNYIASKSDRLWRIDDEQAICSALIQLVLFRLNIDAHNTENGVRLWINNRLVMDRNGRER